MGKDKKRKKPTQDDRSDAEISDAEISDNGDNITNDTTTQHFRRFLLIESIGKNQNITSLSPFVIQKIILGIAGEPENIKKLYRSNQLLVEISKKISCRESPEDNIISQFESESISSYFAEFFKGWGGGGGGGGGGGNSLP